MLTIRKQNTQPADDIGSLFCTDMDYQTGIC